MCTFSYFSGAAVDNDSGGTIPAKRPALYIKVTLQWLGVKLHLA